MRRKWSADKSRGPLVFASELVLKMLIQHSWPCKTVVNSEAEVEFHPYAGRTIGPDFQERLEQAVRIVADEKRVTLVCEGRRLYLHGPHYIDLAGKLRKGLEPAKVANARIFQEMHQVIIQGKDQYRVSEAVLHCAGIPTGWHKGKTPWDVRQDVDNWHKAQGWKGIGYHYVVMPDGFLVLGRPLNQIGSHVIEANRGTLGILMIESRKITRMGEYWDYFTVEQMASIRRITAHHSITKVTGHNDYSHKKLCPGFKVDQSLFLSPKPNAPSVRIDNHIGGGAAPLPALDRGGAD